MFKTNPEFLISSLRRWAPNAAPQFTNRSNNQWEFQDPKMEVLYHIRPYFVGIFPYIGLI